MSVIRIKHKKDYVCIHTGALEDPNLSFKAKGLWAYCMSKTDDWKFHVTHLATVCKDKTTVIYSCIKELIKAGYCEKKRLRDEKGKCVGIEYTIHEVSTLKKFLPHSGFLNEGFLNQGNQPLVNIDNRVSIEKEVNAASPLADFLLLKIRSVNPKFTKGVSPKWIADFQKLLKIRSEEDIRKIITWIFDGSFWDTVVLSPGNLIKNLDKIEMQMAKKDSPKGVSKEWIDKLKERVKNHREINFGKDSISFSCGQSHQVIKFTEHGYKDQILSRLCKMEISIEGL